MQRTLMSQVQSLFQFMQGRPIHDQMAQYLSENFCPSGEITGVTISTLGNNGKVVCNTAVGFLRNDLITGSEIDIKDDRPGSEAMRKLGILILKHSDLAGRFSAFASKNFMADFETAIVMNVTPRMMYGFALQADADNYAGFSEYLDCVRSILNFYENLQNGEFQGQLREQLMKPKNLTNRQEVILRLIKAQKTNAAIANELGYSESLIRQETIIIYRKLGVSGRKELVPEMPN
jgi:DNA-binding CsgD family transcriptional regulator